MYLTQKAFYIWLCLLISLIIINSLSQQRNASIYLPINDPIISITLPENINLHRQDANSPWYVNEYLADNSKVSKLLELLKQPCLAIYYQQTLKSVINTNPIHFKVDGESYVIGNHQELSKTHYIYYQNQVYLCHESIKYYLTQPLEQWRAED